MILATYREPFGVAPHVRHLPEGETLAKMRDRMYGLPDDFDQHGVICLNGHPAPRALWGMIRPKAPTITEITFHQPPMGGGDDGKSVFAIVASIALTVAAGWVAGGGLGGKFGLGVKAFGAGSVGAYVLAAGVSLAGSLLISALVPPPTLQQQGASIQNPGAASAEGNVLEPNTPIPRVLGERKVYPPLASEPLTYFSGPDEVVEAAYVLAGPHRLRDIRIGAASVGSVADIEHEVREGWPGDPLVSMIRRQARTDSVQAELRGHLVDAEDGRTLSTTTGDPTSALPQVQVVATRDAPDEHQLQLIFAQGLHRNGSETDRVRVPIRMRMRPMGASDWINLPELHFQAANLRQLRATIRLVWNDDASTTPSAATTEGWVEARKASPGQTVTPTSPDWAADSYFSGPGADYQDQGNLGTTGVRHVAMDRYTASIFLDRDIFPDGRYEIDIQRGAAFIGSYNPATYTYDGSVWDFWGARGNPGLIAMSRDGLMDTLHLLRSVSIWNQHPLPSRDLAVVAIRARNRAVDRVSVIAGGYVRDWDGDGWNQWTVTSNPAPHLRDIYVGAENMDPVPLDLIDDAGLVTWRQHCIDMDYTVDALLEDQTVDDAARIVASCGYARPYMSDIWGVVRDYDRSAESPVQIFSARNSANYQWTKGFPRVPEGFRVNFRDRTRDFESHQISVFRRGHSDDSGRMEQITVEGLIDADKVIAKANYDQMQAEFRSTFHSWDCAAESVICRQGDLVGLSHDMLTEWHGSARVVGIEVDGGGDITGLALDSVLPVVVSYFLDGSPNLAAEPNLAMLGARSGAQIQRSATVTHSPISGADGNRIFFDPPLDPDGISVGTLLAVGLLGSATLRLVISSVRPKPNFEATITAVDEAPELWI